MLCKYIVSSFTSLSHVLFIIIIIILGKLATVLTMAAPQAAAPPVVVVVNGLAHLLPDIYSGDDTSIDLEEF